MAKVWSLIMLLGAAFTQAEESSSLHQLVMEGLAANPQLQELELHAQKARLREKPRGALPDPMVEVMATNLDFPTPDVGPEAGIGTSLKQGLFTPGKRLARTRAAEAETAVRWAELALFKSSLVLAIRQAYGRLYALDQELVTLREANELFKTLEEVASQRYLAGLTGQESVLKATLQLVRLQERETDVQQQRLETIALLNKLLNRPLHSPLGTVRHLPDVQDPPEHWQEMALERAKKILLAQAWVRAADHEVEVATAELKPNLFVLGGLAQQRSRGSMAHLGFGLEWPLWQASKQRPLLAAARVNLEAARAAEMAAIAETRQEVEEAEAGWTKANEQIARYRNELLPVSEAALNAARDAFLVGQVDFSTVIEDFQLWLETRVGQAQREAGRFSAWAQIQFLLGDEGGES